MAATTPLLQISNLKKHYSIKKWLKKPLVVKALDGVSFEVEKGKTLGIVGESGCGKSTLARLLMRLESPTEGSISWRGIDSQNISKDDYRKQIQMVFQDTYGSLNPRKKAWELVAEPLSIHEGKSVRHFKARALELLEKVGLRPEHTDRYPHMFSGGQRQRIGIARALGLRPEILLCDEPVSALDVSIQAQIINLLLDLQDELGLTYLFISHDLALVRLISDSVVVIYFGRIVEAGTKQQIFNSPTHPYTQALLKSAPILDRETGGHFLKGELPSVLKRPEGCAFQSRCPIATELCQKEDPKLRTVRGRLVACHHANEPKTLAQN